MKRLLSLLALALAAGIARADMAIEVIELKHSFADQLLPQVQTLLPAGASVSAWDNKLIVKTTPENLEQLRTVIERLDRPPERLLITVRYRDNADENRDRAQATLEIDNRDVQLRANVQRYQTQDRHGGEQRIQVMAGQTAQIAVGQEIPTLNSGAQYPYAPGIAYQPVSSGFSVTPRVIGDQVTVDIHPTQERISSRGDGSIDHASLETTVSGHLGEWLSLGGSVQTETQDRRDYTTQGRRYRDQMVEIKVERLP